MSPSQVSIAKILTLYSLTVIRNASMLKLVKRKRNKSKIFKLKNSIRLLKRKLILQTKKFKKAKHISPQLIRVEKIKKCLEIAHQKRIIIQVKKQYIIAKKEYSEFSKKELQKERSKRDFRTIMELADKLTKKRKGIKEQKFKLLRLYLKRKEWCENWIEFRNITQTKKEICRNKLLIRDESNLIPSIKENFDIEKHSFEVQNLNFWYHRKHEQILHDITINIKEKKVTALIGPSGCGKSTFLKCLNRMHDFTPGITIEGNIWFKGKNIFSSTLPPLDLRTQVGMVFQHPTPFPTSIFENVAYSLKCHGIRDQDLTKCLVKEALMDVALWDEVKNHLSFPASTLSGGQQQRLCIARAIVIKPSVLLMDEPTSALDPIAVARIEQLINKLKKNYTIIIVTHSMTQAQRISDETILFYNGKIVECGVTKDFFTNPQKQQTKDYISGKIG